MTACSSDKAETLNLPQKSVLKRLTGEATAELACSQHRAEIEAAVIERDNSIA